MTGPRREGSREGGPQKRRRERAADRWQQRDGRRERAAERVPQRGQHRERVAERRAAKRRPRREADECSGVHSLVFCGGIGAESGADCIQNFVGACGAAVRARHGKHAQCLVDRDPENLRLNRTRWFWTVTCDMDLRGRRLCSQRGFLRPESPLLQRTRQASLHRAILTA